VVLISKRPRPLPLTEPRHTPPKILNLQRRNDGRGRPSHNAEIFTLPGVFNSKPWRASAYLCAMPKWRSRRCRSMTGPSRKSRAKLRKGTLRITARIFTYISREHFPETSFAYLINRAPRPRSPFTVPLSMRRPVPHGAQSLMMRGSRRTSHPLLPTFIPPPFVSSAPLW
jgi:hypothetical protein